jgi:hypothetical protein
MRKILFELCDIPPDRVLDGQFEAYSVRAKLPNHFAALTLLRTLASIVAPHMRRHSIIIGLSEEFEYPNLLEVNHHEYDVITYVKKMHRIQIQIRLRPHDKPTEFMPLGELLSTLCHELAHCWHVVHDLSFYLKYKQLLEELDEDLQGTVVITPFREHTEIFRALGNPKLGCWRFTKTELECAKFTRHVRSGGNQKAIQAVTDWQDWWRRCRDYRILAYRRNRKRDYRKSKSKCSPLYSDLLTKPPNNIKIKREEESLQRGFE